MTRPNKLERYTMLGQKSLSVQDTPVHKLQRKLNVVNTGPGAILAPLYFLRSLSMVQIS